PEKRADDRFPVLDVPDDHPFGILHARMRDPDTAERGAPIPEALPRDIEDLRRLHIPRDRHGREARARRCRVLGALAGTRARHASCQSQRGRTGQPESCPCPKCHACPRNPARACPAHPAQDTGPPCLTACDPRSCPKFCAVSALGGILAAPQGQEKSGSCITRGFQRAPRFQNRASEAMGPSPEARRRAWTHWPRYPNTVEWTSVTRLWS